VNLTAKQLTYIGGANLIESHTLGYLSLCNRDAPECAVSGHYGASCNRWPET